MSLAQCCALGRCVGTVDLKQCSACSEVKYCCREHQVEHFKEGGHKMICPGKKSSAPLTFKECAEKATKHHTAKMWVATLPYYGAMLEFTERTLGLFHPQVANILDAMHTCYAMLSKYEQSIQCIQRVLIIRELVSESYLQDPDAAVQTSSEAVEASKAVFSTMGQLAELYMAAGNLQLAKELLIKTEEVAVEMFGENSFERGRAVCALAGCHDREDEKEQAIKELLRATEITGYGQCTEQAELIAASNAYYNLGVMCSTSEEKNGDANIYYKKALEMKIKGGLPSNHQDIAEIKLKLIAS